jgi:hypothetical protein
MGSSDRLELRKEYSPRDVACLGLMQKQSHFSVKIVALGKFLVVDTSNHKS